MALLDMVEKQQIFITKTLQLKPQREQNNDKGQQDIDDLIAANTLAQTTLTEAKTRAKAILMDSMQLRQSINQGHNIRGNKLICQFYNCKNATVYNKESKLKALKPVDGK